MTDEQINAEVLVLANVGKDTTITAETIQALSPDVTTMDAVQQYFTDQGFAVTYYAGVSFTISADQATFDKAFGAHAGAQANELPLDNLAVDVRKHIHGITLATPLDFGPTEYL